MPKHLPRALIYALLIWLSGFVWGSIVLAVPPLRDIPAIPYISTNLAISLPIIVFWIWFADWLTLRYLGLDDAHEDKIGLKLGVLFVIVNAGFDIGVIVYEFNAGWAFYSNLTVWLAYAVLLIVPIRVAGRG